MPVRQTILRASALAVLAGSGLAAALNMGLIGAASRPAAPAQVAQPAPDQPPAAPALPLTADTAGVRLPASAPMPPALPVAAGAPVPAPLPDAAPQAAPATDIARSPLGLPCGLEVAGTAMPGAMVALDVMDPCRPGMRVEVEHAGLTFAAATDAMGLLTLDVPALEAPAIFTVRLADETLGMALVPVPDLGGIGRVAVAWEEDRAIELHAFENDAAFGAPGHVWQDAPGDVTLVTAGTGGVLTRLGDPTVEAPRIAQVYTYPVAVAGALALSVDIPVTSASCGQPVRAQSLRLRDGAVETQEIRLTLPGCDAVGDYLVLQNLFDDLRLAGN
ncbi:hypothetical protein [Roseicyclus persicicus]|uniref:Translocase n=1 Tax=Roseicyclus persicicus TaxID=2650661 RepID=A0A7X6GZC5_9RHOB|nr:hypothetical protein [Roseibacterium persicicum]NKX45186.1 hypothetical protein [Roseibacterium persicicum]